MDLQQVPHLSACAASAGDRPRPLTSETRKPGEDLKATFSPGATVSCSCFCQLWLAFWLGVVAGAPGSDESFHQATLSRVKSHISAAYKGSRVKQGVLGGPGEKEGFQPLSSTSQPVPDPCLEMGGKSPSLQPPHGLPLKPAGWAALTASPKKAPLRAEAVSALGWGWGGMGLVVHFTPDVSEEFC